MLITAQKYLKQTKLWGTTTKNQNNKKIKQNLNDTKAQMAGCQQTSTIATFSEQDHFIFGRVFKQC